MNPTPDEKRPEGQTQKGEVLSDSELEQVSGGTGWSSGIVDWNPEIEYGEP